MDGVTAQSWHTTRAAVLYQLADECRRWRGVTDRTLDLAEAVDAAKRARHAVLAYRKVLAMTRPEPEKPRRSKRSTLPRMRWQRVAFDAATRGNVPLWLLCGPPDAGPQRSSAGSRSGVMVMPGHRNTGREGHGRQGATDPPDRRRSGLRSGPDHRDDAGQSTGRPRSKESQAHSGRFRGHPPPFGLGAISAYSFRHQSASDMKGRATIR